jgi:glutathione synthase/RimK-type ligase-like ATP-grasp enzyme
MEEIQLPAMKIGIHLTKGYFSERWVSYCKKKGIEYKLVDCFKNDIIDQLTDCDALMWHFNHKGPKESKFAKQLIYSLQIAGKKVFPDFNTVWHFDDKLGQKYLLEAIGAPIAPVSAFYDRKAALEWADNTKFPKVFKLRTGSGSDSVRLVNSRNEARRYIKKAFRSGFKHYDGWNNLKERIRKFRDGKAGSWEIIKGIIRILYTTEYARVAGREKGYIYFQDFIPDNDHDIRVVVIGDKAFAIKRMVRNKDFRASGSGFILYEKDLFDEKTISLSFKIAEKLKTQCIAFDYVHLGGRPLIVEISYGFSPTGYDPCPGYWDKNLVWHEGTFDPYGWMVEDLLRSVDRKEESGEL